MSILKPIANEKQEKRGWKLELNGEPVDHVTSLQLKNDRFGTLEYGETPPGYDGWAFEEVGGGGSVIVPYVILGQQDDPNYPSRHWNELFIGVVQQDRYTMGGKVWNLPRGFLGENETHFEAAKREAGEELRFNVAERFTELPGLPTNSNSAFFVTLGDDKGVRFYGLEIRSEEITRGTTDDYRSVYKLRDDLLKPVSKVGELIFGCNFVPYEQALSSNDMFTVAGVGRLLPTVMSKIK